MNVRYVVELTEDERCALRELTQKGKPSACKVKRANILLMADRRKHTDTEIVEGLSSSTSTVYRTKRDFVEEGLVAAIHE